MEPNTSKALELKKHIYAIHCTNSLSLVERKLANALLYNAYPDLPNKSIFEITAKQLCQLIGYNSHDYAKLKKALKALMSTIIEWNVIDYTTSNADKWRASSILAGATLENGICTYEYSATLKELLFRPEMYGRINMQIQARFSSSYALALYENCIRYRGLPQTPWFTLEIFRKLMGITGDKYSAFKELRKRVIDIAVKEVNEHSDVIIKPEVKKVNKKVVAIRFTICDKVVAEQATHLAVDSNLAETLINEFGLSPEVTKDILNTYETGYIKEKIAVTLDSASFKAGKITVLAGFLIEALRKNYQPNKSSRLVLEHKKKEKEKLEQIEKGRKLRTEENTKKYNQYIQKHIDSYLEQLDKSAYDLLIKDFIEYMNRLPGAQVYQKAYKKYGIVGTGLIASCMRSFLKETKPKLFDSLLSYDGFIRKSDELETVP